MPKRRTLMQRVITRLFPGSSHGPAFYRIGDYVTFRTSGFAGGSLPEVLGRTHYEVRVLRQALEALPRSAGPRKSLEIGCGYGRLSAYIAEYVDEAHSVDINPQALREAKRLYPHVNFAEASATQLPFGDDSFDVVVSWTVLQHVMPHLIDGALAELNRVAKDSATIVLCEATLHADNPQPPDAHTHDRPPEFYANGFPGRPMLISRYIEEMDRIDGLASPGRLMVLGPRESA
jgi:SAM-dependent methyltransferase